VVYLVGLTTSLQTFRRMLRWKKNENRSIFRDDMDKICGLILGATPYTSQPGKSTFPMLM